MTEGLNKAEGNISTPASIHSSRISTPVTSERHSDDDFKPNQDSSDDEETIAKAEEEMKSNHKEEIELLKKESELTLEDFIKELPPNYLEERDKSLSPLPRDVIEEVYCLTFSIFNFILLNIFIIFHFLICNIRKMIKVVVKTQSLWLLQMNRPLMKKIQLMNKRNKKKMLITNKNSMILR